MDLILSNLTKRAQVENGNDFNKILEPWIRVSNIRIRFHQIKMKSLQNLKCIKTGQNRRIDKSVNKLVKSLNKFNKSVIEINSKIGKPLTYIKVVNYLIYKSR